MLNSPLSFSGPDVRITSSSSCPNFFHRLQVEYFSWTRLVVHAARVTGIKCNISLNITDSKLVLGKTRLLWSYTQLDQRCRTLGLFSKSSLRCFTVYPINLVEHWSKRWARPSFPLCLIMFRKINSPNEGTLSSYGYVLLVIYFLVHGTKPPSAPKSAKPLVATYSQG